MCGNVHCDSFKLGNEKNVMKILILYDKSAPKYHRLLLPTFLMSGIEVRSSWFPTDEDLNWCDILFYNRIVGRPVGGTFEMVVQEWKRRYSFKIVVDFDDHWVLEPDHYLYDQYKEYGISKAMEENIRLADAVTVTHERLAEAVFPLNKNVHILPNAIPKFDQFLFKKTPDDLVRLFWAGGVTHFKDLELIKRPLELVKSKGVKLVIGGYSKGAKEEWDKMVNVFTTNSSYNTLVLEALPVEKYYALYSQCDISLIPLCDTRFNAYKSNLKILEAANIGSPVVVSKVHPYLGFPDELVNYVDGRGNTWYKQITKLLNAPGMMAYQGQRLKEYCDTNFNFNEINLKRKQIFESVKQGNTREPAECLNG